MTIKQFTSSTGPTVDIPESPLDIFELFFSDDIITKMVEETNRYAEQVMGEERYREWRKITKEELKAFFGFSILMGIDRLPSVDDYWSKDPFSTTLLLQIGFLGGVSARSPGTCTL